MACPRAHRRRPELIGALLLVVVISPGREWYRGLIVTWEGDNPGLKRYLRDQAAAGALVLVGTTLQLLAAAFA